MSSTNVMEKNNRKVEITNDSGKLTVKAVADSTDVSENKWDELENIDMRFHRQHKSEEEFKALLRRRLEYRLEVARRIAKLRVRRGMSQVVLSREAGLTSQTIGNIEVAAWNVSQNQLERIARALGTTPDYLKGIVPAPDNDLILYEGVDLQKAIAIAKMYLASSLEPDDFKAQIETVLEALSHLELNEPIEEILAS